GTVLALRMHTFFFSSRRRHTRFSRDWSSDVCSSDLAAKDGVLPKRLSKENRSGSPSASLWLTNGLIQAFILVVLFAESTYQALYSMAGVAILLPYLFSALYQLKLAWTGESYGAGERRGKDLLLGIVATLYSMWLVYAGGLGYLGREGP